MESAIDSHFAASPPTALRRVMTGAGALLACAAAPAAAIALLYLTEGRSADPAAPRLAEAEQARAAAAQ